MRSITQRIDRVTLIEQSKKSLAPPAPRSVKIEATGGQCNYRCRFCTLKDRVEQPTRPMDWDLFCRIMREMKEAGVEEVGLFYISEPFFLPRRLIACIEYAKELRFEYVFVTTNGSLATPQWVEEAMRVGLNSIKFSVNFVDEDQFVSITQRPAINYRRALDNLRRAREVRDAGGYDCGIFASYIQFTGDQELAMERILNERVRPYVDECYALPLYSFGGSEINGVGKPTAGNQGRIGALRDGLPCWSLWEGHIRSSADGSRAYLSACCFGSDGRFDVADLSRVGFMDAWHSAPFQELRRAHLAKDVSGTVCEKCLAYGN